MVIPVLADVLNATEKEKVKRIILASFRVRKLILFFFKEYASFQPSEGKAHFLKGESIRSK
jgi:hypothetical protein